MEPSSAPLPLLLYDGECGLCARSVQFVLARDRRQRIHFAALQSTLGRSVAAAHGLDPEELSSMIFVDESGRALVRSTAALEVSRDLRAPWSLGRFLLIVPRILRDGVYRVVARYRIRLFGTADSCRLPDPSTSKRFLT